MAEAVEMAGGDESSPGYNFRQTAALACITKRRTDPDFTYEQALDLKTKDLDIISLEDDNPEARSGNTGVLPLASLATGT